MLESLPKYHYKPLIDKVQEAYLANAQKEYDPGVDIGSHVTLVVDADSQEHSQQVCYGFIDVRMWELFKTED